MSHGTHLQSHGGKWELPNGHVIAGQTPVHWIHDGAKCSQNYVFDKFLKHTEAHGGTVGTCESVGFPTLNSTFAHPTPFGLIPFENYIKPGMIMLLI